METNYVTYTRVGKRLIHPSKRKHFDPSSKIVKMKKFSSVDPLVPKIKEEKNSPIIATGKGIYFKLCMYNCTWSNKKLSAFASNKTDVDKIFFR